MAGIIPADAGSTANQTESDAKVKDHPRGCGEHYRVFIVSDTTTGSSPRMRGARIEQRVLHPQFRIIPADAGSTTCVSACGRRYEDHPRGCGEHYFWNMVVIQFRGSSPRMRGALIVVGLSIGPWRIIPADAGSTVFLPVSYALCMDHPRGCGEHGYRRFVGKVRIGSSPRMRGAPSVQPVFE